MFLFCSTPFRSQILNPAIHWSGPCNDAFKQPWTSRNETPVPIRPLDETDYPGVQALHRAVGWPARSLAGWRWLHSNPARAEIAAPAGWVVDAGEGELAGHVGNLIQRFRHRGRTLYGATGFSIIVLPSARGQGQRIIRTFHTQKGLFARWTFNANAVSQPLYARHGMTPWPEQTHALKLGWPVAPLPLIAGKALKALHRLAPAAISRLDEQLMNDRLGRAIRLALPQGVSLLEDVSDASPYADFWTALSAEDRLLSDRSPAILRWRLADPDQTQTPLLLAVQRDGVMTGYAMAQMAKGNILEPPVLEIVDLEALAGHADAVPLLMTALKGAAKQLGAAKLRLPVVSPLQLARLGAFADSARREGGWGHCHVIFEDQAVEQAWSPTPWDGDQGFCLRPVPLKQDTRGRRPLVAGSSCSKA